MSGFKDFRDELFKHGQQMTNCQFGSENPCKGIHYDRSKGVIPRCLFLEEREATSTEEITVVIGLNPGKARVKEKKALANETDYQKVRDYFDEEYLSHPFYRRATALVNGLGFKGPILWTEIAKCEGSGIWRETMVFCASHYLVKEIALAKKHFTKVRFIVLSQTAFNPLIFLLNTDKVMGVPHPTGAYGSKFSGMFDKDWKLNKDFKKDMLKFFNDEGEDGWLRHQYFTAE
jgi:hypothetical protein